MAVLATIKRKILKKKSTEIDSYIKKSSQGPYMEKKIDMGQHRWLVYSLTTQETEIRRITI
jgi:hypothetical protein